MAKVVLCGLDAGAILQASRVIDSNQHQIVPLPGTAPVHACLDADIVFACADRNAYVPLLRAIRKARQEMAFIVVSRLPETAEWLDALEAGATDYCALPLDRQQVCALLEAAAPRLRAAAAAA